MRACGGLYAILSYQSTYRGDMTKFRISKSSPTSTKSIRFPNDVIEGAEDAIRGQDRAFTAFVVEAVRVALENLAEDKETQKEPPSA